MPRPKLTKFDKILGAGAVAVGLILMVVGAIGLLLPTHLLGALFVLGLILVLRNSMRARRRFVRLKRRYPRYLHPLRRLLRRDPEVAPVVWREVLRSERWWLPAHRRRLRVWRRKVRRKTRPDPR